MIRVLLVADEAELSENAKPRLEREGDLDVTLTGSVDEALVLLEKQDMDAIVSNHRLPRMNGIEILKKMRDRGDQRPFILIVDKDDEDVALEYLDIGADGYILWDGDHGPRFDILARDLLRRVRLHEEREALSESVERLELANEVADHGIWDWDLDTDNVHLSTRCYTMLGYDPGQLPMDIDAWRGLLHPEDKGKWLPFEKEAVVQGTSCETTFRLRTKGGEWRWILGRGRHFEFDEAGNPHRMMGINVDNTEQRSMEERLHLTMFSVKNASLGLYWIAPDGRFLNTNDGACEMLGYSKDEFMEMSIWDIDPDPDYGSGIREDRWKRLKEEGPLTFKSVHMTKDGRAIDVDITSQYIEFDGKEYEFAFAMDITERVRAEEWARRNLEFYMRLWNTMGDMVLILDEEGHFIEANDAALNTLGYSREELRSMTPVDIDILADNELVRERMARAIEEGELRFDSAHLTKSGERLYTNVAVSPFDHCGMKGILCVMRDITERKVIENALRLANEKLYMMGAITRHDILNQLTNLSGYIELARDGINNERYLKKALDASSRIQKILELGREYESLGTQNATWIRLREAIQTGLVTVDLSETEIAVDVEEIEVLADPMFEKVFHNLVDNAIRHGKARKIGIHTSRQGENLEVIVEDDGIGIEKGRKDIIFKPESGFGLHFSMELLSITGIDIGEDGMEGRGARFVMTIPPDRYR